MALSANAPLSEVVGKYGEHPVAASATIYEGSMCGAASGYARALTAGDLFLGHAFEKVDNSAGSAGDKDVKLLTGIYRLQVTLTSVAITDIGKDVYASDDGTLTLTAGSNSRVGRVHRYVTTNTCVVEFHAQQGSDLPDHEHTGGTDGGKLTSPHVATAIEDTNGNAIIGLGATASADNYWKLHNNKLNSTLVAEAAGVSATIGVKIRPKGASGTIQLGSVNTQKIGLYDVSPTAQPSAVADPTGSTAASLRAVQVKILAALRVLGVIDA
jgi:hypothetical protein